MASSPALVPEQVLAEVMEANAGQRWGQEQGRMETFLVQEREKGPEPGLAEGREGPEQA